MRFKVILFDVDGLVIHSPRFSERLQKEYGITWETMKPFFQGPFQECKIGKADLRIEVEKVMSSWGWKDSVDALIDYWFQADKVDEEIKRLILNLKQQGVSCYLATNQEKYRAEYFQSNLGLGKIFDGIFTSANLGCLKSNPNFFKKIIEHLNEKGSQILFVDHDKENTDAAESVGISTHLFHDLETLKEFLAK